MMRQAPVISAPSEYNQVGLAMYERPNCVLAWALLLLHGRDAANESRAA